MKHHLLIIGVAEYQPGWGVIRDGVEAEVVKAKSLFIDLLKFEPATFSRVSDTTEKGIKDQTADWCEKVRTSSGATTNDLLVVYYTGHGIVENSIFHLVTSEVREDRPATAMQLASLIPLIWTGDRHVLLILDTCQSRAGAGDALPLIDRLREAVGGAARAHGAHIITTARSIENARTRAFIDGLEEVIRSDRVGGPDEEFLRPDAIMKQVNDVLATKHGVDTQQHAELSNRAEGLFQFFPNPRWEPRLRVGMDSQEAQRVLGYIRQRGMQSHWRPRARGVALDSEPGWYFTGRSKALRKVLSWMGTPSGQAGMIVTGPPGSGKSALLARIVTLADPEVRDLALQAGALEGVPPDELPSIGALGGAVYARAKTSAEVALELAVTMGADLQSGETDPESLALQAAAIQKSATVLIIDALDEAQNPEQLCAFVRLIVDRAKEIRVIVGLRGGEHGSYRLLERLKARFTSLDIGSEEYLDHADVKRYVERYLLHTPSSPIVKAGQAYASEVAEAVAASAGQSFLVASTTAKVLTLRDEVISHAELGQLPSAAGEAFEFDFKLLSQSEREEAVYIFGALAFAHGRGLPRTLWVPFANALGKRHFSSSDLDQWIGRAGYYVTREESLSSSIVRLYHEEFARYLRQKVRTILQAFEDATEDPDAILIETMRAMVPNIPGSRKRNWVDAPDYVRNYFPMHLKAAGRVNELYGLVLDQGWVLARTQSRDPTLLLEDLDLAIQVAHQEAPVNVNIIARCCLAYGRCMTTAPPLIVDVLAAAGQMSRAESIADNINYALDRCQAFCLLAERNAFRHLERARQQLMEARRSAHAVRGSYRAMTSYWVVRAAIALRDRETAEQIARTELYRTLLMIQRAWGEPVIFSEWWDEPQVLCRTMNSLDDLGVLEPPEQEFPRARVASSERWMEIDHALFWTVKALREVGDKRGLDTIRQLFDDTKRYGFNLRLQTAGVVGDITFLESFLPWHGGELPQGPGGILRGNLALALATAGRREDVIRLLGDTRALWETNTYLEDSAKRLAWALALCGKFEEAIAYIGLMIHPEERLRALYRVTEVLLSQESKAELDTVANLAERFLAEDEEELKRSQVLSLAESAKLVGAGRNAMLKLEPSGCERWQQFTGADFWRLRSWASWILAAAGRMDRALDLAEAVCAEEINPSENSSLIRPTRLTEMRKLHVTPAVGPNPDEQMMEMALSRAGANELDEASRLAGCVASARHRARARVGVAVKLQDKQRALELCLSALLDARRVGQGLVIQVLQSMSKLLRDANQAQSLAEIVNDYLNSQVRSSETPPSR